MSSAQLRSGADYDPYDLLGDFRTSLWLPRYRLGQSGPWTIQRIMMVASRGYRGEVYRTAGTVILSGPGSAGRASWMSMTPSEIESQEIGLIAARGHTVVLGMGMGWLAANAALKPEVTHVTVVERDRNILELMHEQAVFEQLPPEARDKLEIVEADALAWRPSVPVDSLQADIWERFVEDDKLAHARTMQDNIGAASVYFWGQEMEIFRLACRRFASDAPQLDRRLIDAIVAEDIALPLVLPDWPDLAEKITAAAAWWTPKTEGWWH